MRSRNGVHAIMARHGKKLIFTDQAGTLFASQSHRDGADDAQSSRRGQRSLALGDHVLPTTRLRWFDSYRGYSSYTPRDRLSQYSWYSQPRASRRLAEGRGRGAREKWPHLSS